ncbi:hypothetical protein LOAG_11781 [Loa loa]|uniref:Uncharacterized protein n=1 Tax=Loa loa TaxID=7209 RepID=A0A1I7VPN7_LOALO|nr:hypothetical protein LOAG_11781 [Loa loa]EFO16722.2 hypothetical protein LOAG_11781 [Loa loa]
MFLSTILFIVLPLLLYAIYELLGRKLTIGEIDRKAVLIAGYGSREDFCGTENDPEHWLGFLRMMNHRTTTTKSNYEKQAYIPILKLYME